VCLYFAVTDRVYLELFISFFDTEYCCLCLQEEIKGWKGTLDCVYSMSNNRYMDVEGKEKINKLLLEKGKASSRT